MNLLRLACINVNSYEKRVLPVWELPSVEIHIIDNEIYQIDCKMTQRGQLWICKDGRRTKQPLVTFSRLFVNMACSGNTDFNFGYRCMIDVHYRKLLWGVS